MIFPREEHLMDMVDKALDENDRLREHLLERGRPPLRQPIALTSEPLVRSDSWWTKAERSNFTERAAAERHRMVNDVIGRKVPDQIMGKYIGLVRPTE